MCKTLFMSVLSRSGVCVSAVEACDGGSVPEGCVRYSAAAGVRVPVGKMHSFSGYYRFQQTFISSGLDEHILSLGYTLVSRIKQS